MSRYREGGAVSGEKQRLSAPSIPENQNGKEQQDIRSPLSSPSWLLLTKQHCLLWNVRHEDYQDRIRECRKNSNSSIEQCSFPKASKVIECCDIKLQGNSVVVQWLRLCTSTAGGRGSILGLRTKIPQARRHAAKKKKNCRMQIKISNKQQF